MLHLFLLHLLQGGRWVTNRQKIVARYAKRWLWIDIAAAIPFDVPVAFKLIDISEGGTGADMYKYLLGGKLIRIAKLVQVLTRMVTALTHYFQLSHSRARAVQYLGNPTRDSNRPPAKPRAPGPLCAWRAPCEAPPCEAPPCCRCCPPAHAPPTHASGAPRDVTRAVMMLMMPLVMMLMMLITRAVMMLILAHYMSIAWAYFGLTWEPGPTSLPTEQSWIDYYGMQSYSSTRLYLVSTYVSCCCVFGGLSTIAPHNFTEYGVISAMLLIGGVAWAGVLSDMVRAAPGSVGH